MYNFYWIHMIFFKQAVVLSILFLGLNVDAMEKDQASFLIEARNSYFNEYDYGSKSNDDSLNQSDTSTTIFSFSFNISGERSENAPRESDYRNDQQQDFKENNAHEMIAEERARQERDRYDTSTTYVTETTQKIEQKNEVFQADNSFYKPHTNFLKQLDENLSSKEYRNNLLETRALLEKAWNQYTFGNTELKKHIQFIDALLNGSIKRLLNDIQTSDLKTAKKAFAELKKAWPWKDSEFGCSVLGNSVSESRFIKLIGIDVMQVARNSLLLRKDYLASNNVSISQIISYKSKIRDAQLQGDRKYLIAERQRLTEAFLKESYKAFKFTIEAKLIILNTILSNPTTQIFHTIKNGKPAQAIKALEGFQTLLFMHFKEHGFETMDEARADLIKREGVDLLEAAQKCFKSRPDYHAITGQQKLNPEKQHKSFETDLKSSALLQKYTENQNKRIMAEQNQNEQILNARKDALKFVSQNPTISRGQSYSLNSKTSDVLRLYNINPEQYAYCTGNEAQQQLRSEHVALLNGIVEIPFNEYTQQCFDRVITYTQIADAYTQSNDLEKAFSLTDLAWAAFDCAKAVYNVYNNVNTSITKTNEIISEGIIQGCINAVCNTAHMVRHPREALCNIGAAFSHFTLCLIEFAYLTDDDFVTLDNFDVIEENAQRRNEKIDAMIDAAKQITLKGTVTFVTEQIITGQILNFGISAIKQCAKPSMAQLARLGQALNDKAVNRAPKFVKALRQTLTDTLEPNPGLATTEGLILNVEETGLLHNAMDQTGNIKSTAKNQPHINENPSLNNSKVVSSSINTIQHEAETLLAKDAKLLDQLNKLKSPNTTKAKRLSWGLDTKNYERLLRKADEQYEKIRALTDDIAIIAKNTGIPEGFIEKVKNHIFYDIHELRSGELRRFYADANMAAAWERLIDNNFLQNDLLLLQHEYAEAVVTHGLNIQPGLAHDIVDKIYDWNNSLLKG